MASQEAEGRLDTKQVVLWTILSLLAVGAIAFVGTGFDLGMFKFWAPKYENVRREVFEQTQSYVQGKEDYLEQLRLEYESTTEQTHKKALRTMILAQAQTVDNNKLPLDMQIFINSIR